MAFESLSEITFPISGLDVSWMIIDSTFIELSLCSGHVPGLVWALDKVSRYRLRVGGTSLLALSPL